MHTAIHHHVPVPLCTTHGHHHAPVLLYTMHGHHHAPVSLYITHGTSVSLFLYAPHMAPPCPSSSIHHIWRLRVPVPLYTTHSTSMSLFLYTSHMGTSMSLFLYTLHIAPPCLCSSIHHTWHLHVPVTLYTMHGHLHVPVPLFTTHRHHLPSPSKTQTLHT